MAKQRIEAKTFERRAQPQPGTESPLFKVGVDNVRAENKLPPALPKKLAEVERNRDLSPSESLLHFQRQVAAEDSRVSGKPGEVPDLSLSTRKGGPFQSIRDNYETVGRPSGAPSERELAAQAGNEALARIVEQLRSVDLTLAQPGKNGSYFVSAVHHIRTAHGLNESLRPTLEEIGRNHDLSPREGIHLLRHEIAAQASGRRAEIRAEPLKELSQAYLEVLLTSSSAPVHRFSKDTDAKIKSAGGTRLAYRRDVNGFVINNNRKRLVPVVGEAWTLSEVQQEMGANHALALSMRENGDTVLFRPAQRGEFFKRLEPNQYPATHQERRAYLERYSKDIEVPTTGLVEMRLASELGFPIGQKLTLEAPGGATHTKPAGKDAFFVPAGNGGWRMETTEGAPPTGYKSLTQRAASTRKIESPNQEQASKRITLDDVRKAANELPNPQHVRIVDAQNLAPMVEAAVRGSGTRGQTALAFAQDVSVWVKEGRIKSDGAVRVLTKALNEGLGENFTKIFIATPSRLKQVETARARRQERIDREYVRLGSGRPRRAWEQSHTGDVRDYTVSFSREKIAKGIARVHDATPYGGGERR